MDEQLKIFVPLTKIDEEKRLVYGVLAEEAVDKKNEIFDYAESKPHFEAWSKMFKDATAATGQEESLGNLRAMHQPKAVGKFTEIVFNDGAKRVEVCGKVYDDSEWDKVKGGVYTGFSIGGGYAKKWPDALNKAATRYAARPAEGSLVDNPCMYGAQFTAIKADGAEELRKFVGGELEKDATGAIAAADSALDSLKTLAKEVLTMTGDPDTWTLDSILSAIRGTLSAKSSAQYAAEAGKAAPEGDLKKVDDPNAVAKTEGVDTPTPAAAPDQALVKLVSTAVEEALAKVAALPAAVEALQADMKKWEPLLEGLKKTPVAAGTPAEKVLGGAGPAGDAGELDVAQLETAVQKLESTGQLSPSARLEARTALATLSCMKLSRS